MKYNSVAPLRSIPPIRLTFSAISIVFSIVFALAAFGVNVPVGPSWTYQGQLRRSGAAYTGTCDFQFTLWDAASGGTQQGSAQNFIGLNVVNGLFTVPLDFPVQFLGAARWLGTSVQCSGDVGFTSLDPRQPITAAPYALGLRPGAGIIDFDASSSLPALTAQSLSSFGIGLNGTSAGQNGVGVKGGGSGTNSAGVLGENSSGVGVWGRSTGTGAGILGESLSTGPAGKFSGLVQVFGPLTVGTNSSTGVFATGATGVQGQTNAASGGSGVAGYAALTNSAGVYGENRDSAAIWGKSTGNGSAVFGENTGAGFAGRFIGPVNVQGTLTKSAGTFKIDHPLDPAHKFLSHSFVESPDMKNIYDGTVTTDATGSATVSLPAYFAALNRDYRYQLTVLGQFAQAVVSRKIIADNTFQIRTDKPGVEVSWQVSGIRQDAYAKENPIVVEQAKSAEEDGKYLYPAGFGAGEEKRIGHSNGPAPRPGAPDRLSPEQGEPARK